MRFFKWLRLLSLRLYKKPSFVAILVVIPICVATFSIAAEEDSGFLHIVLAQEDASEPVSSEIIADLQAESSIIRYSVASPDEAEKAVKTGKADAAWIFPKKLGERLDSFVKSSYFDDGFVKIIEKDSSIPLRLSHEKLSSTMFKTLSQYYYLNYIRSEVPDFDRIGDAELLGFYDRVTISDELFTVTDIDGNETEEISYLTSPIRGLLSIVVMLGGMAAAMFCIRDEQTGTFSRIAERDRVYVNFACILIAVVNIAVFAVAALCIGGLSTGLLRECAAMAMYSLCVAVFCLFFKQIFRTARVYGSAIPLFTVVMIAVCPVFFELKNLGAVHFLLPPSLYLGTTYDNAGFLHMVLYAVIVGGMCLAADRIVMRKR